MDHAFDVETIALDLPLSWPEPLFNSCAYDAMIRFVNKALLKHNHGCLVTSCVQLLSCYDNQN